MSTAVTGGPLIVAAAVSAAAGAVSFASPCVVPLVPGYLAFISGLSGAQLDRAGARARGTVAVGSVLFVLGFAVFFTLIGGAFGAVGRVLADYRHVVTAVGGLLVIGLGLFLLGAVRPARLSGEARMWRLARRSGLLGAFPLGVVFGAGWTPCIGPTLGSILTLSAVGGGADATRGAVLGFSYAAGLGVPFVVIALLLGRSVRLIGALRRRTPQIQRAGGALLVALGLLLVSGYWDRLLTGLRPLLTRYSPTL